MFANATPSLLCCMGVAAASNHGPKLNLCQFFGRIMMTCAACTKSTRRYRLPRLVMLPNNRICFKNGRQFAAWLGLVPKQRSSGGKSRLFGISKRGDRYLRTLLIHGACAVLRKAGDKTDARSVWIERVRDRRHPNLVAVALANKNARIVWAVLSGRIEYQPAFTD
ncbi:IS110 family transposase [Shimia sp. R9_1]|nr:IS110 family transposase [Shimia sp. R9_1]